MADKKSVLIINRRPPYGTANAREALDVALTCAIFEMPVTLLFLGDGVFQLLKDQAPEAINQKKHEAMLSSLPMYDIDNICVVADDLIQRSLNENDLCLPVNTLTVQQYAEMIGQHEAVLSF